MRLINYILVALLLVSAASLEACGRRGDLSPPPSGDSDDDRQNR